MITYNDNQLHEVDDTNLGMDVTVGCIEYFPFLLYFNYERSNCTFTSIIMMSALKNFGTDILYQNEIENLQLYYSQMENTIKRTESNAVNA